MGVSYDPEHIARMFDEYADQEWDRHERSTMTRVSMHVHLEHLRRFVREGDAVLEVGAGAGRFTVELARLGASVSVIDISPVQIELNRARVGEAGLEDRIAGRAVADMLDLSAFADASFDAVVCFGGPLSYALDRAEDALDELLRVTRPGGLLLVSVMSHLGSIRAFLAALADEWDSYGPDNWQAIFESGDLPQDQSTTAPMHMFRWSELRGLLEQQGVEIVAASAANFLSAGGDEVADAWRHDPERWERFLAWEVSSCAEPGTLDGGTHIIVVGRRAVAVRS